MKKKVTISIEESVIEKLGKIVALRDDVENKSHFVAMQILREYKKDFKNENNS